MVGTLNFNQAKAATLAKLDTEVMRNDIEYTLADKIREGGVSPSNVARAEVFLNNAKHYAGGNYYSAENQAALLAANPLHKVVTKEHWEAVIKGYEELIAAMNAQMKVQGPEMTAAEEAKDNPVIKKKSWLQKLGDKSEDLAGRVLYNATCKYLDSQR